jgi:hypothetical protein
MQLVLMSMLAPFFVARFPLEMDGRVRLLLTISFLVWLRVDCSVQPDQPEKNESSSKCQALPGYYCADVEYNSSKHCPPSFSCAGQDAMPEPCPHGWTSAIGEASCSMSDKMIAIVVLCSLAGVVWMVATCVFAREIFQVLSKPEQRSRNGGELSMRICWQVPSWVRRPWARTFWVQTSSYIFCCHVVAILFLFWLVFSASLPVLEDSSKLCEATPGHFCPNESSNQTLACPIDFKCAGKNAMPTVCPRGWRTDGAGSSSCARMTNELMVIIVLGCLTVVVVLIAAATMETYYAAVRFARLKFLPSFLF